MNDINKPLSNEEIHKLLTTTQRWPLDQKVIHRMLATLPEIIELKKENKRLKEEIENVHSYYNERMDPRLD